MAVGFVIISGEFGGAETVVYKILENINKDTNYYLFTNDEVLEHFSDINNVQTVSLGELKYSSGLAYVGLNSRYRSASKRLYDVCKSNNIDHLILNLPPSLSLLQTKSKIATSFVIHGSMGLDYQSTDSVVRQHTIEKVKKRIILRNLNKVDHLISACQYFIDLIRKEGVTTKHTIIPNGINENMISQRKEVFNDNEFDIFYSGGARDVKGWDLLLDAINRLHKDGYQFKINFLRDIPQDHRIRKFVSEYDLAEKTRFLGYCERENYLDYMYSADIVCLPSYTEGIASSVMDALALGKPLVATDVGGTPEMITHKENGYLCEPNPTSIQNGLEYFINSPDEVDRVGSNNLVKSQQYTWKSIVKEYEELISNDGNNID